MLVLSRMWISFEAHFDGGGSEAGQHAQRRAKEPPGQAGAVVHVENPFHGPSDTRLRHRSQGHPPARQQVQMPADVMPPSAWPGNDSLNFPALG